MRLVIDLLDPRGEQPVHLGQVGHCPARLAVPAGDLDAEFLLDGAEEALDLASALRPSRRGVDQRDAQLGAGPQQPRVDESAAVVHVDVVRDAACGQRGPQGRREPDGVFGQPPPVPGHRPGMIVEEGEQVGFPPADTGPVQGVPDPDLIGPVSLEPAGCLRRLTASGEAGQPGPGEHPLQGPLARSPAQLGQQDPADLGGGPPGVLLLQRRGQLHHLGRQPRGRLAGRGHQRVEPAPAPVQDPPVQRPAGKPHRPAGQISVLPLSQGPDHPPALPRRQRRVSGLPDEHVTEQADLPGPLQPGLLIISCCRHAVSNLHVADRYDLGRLADDDHRA
jgi:hypothetical protein